MPVLLVVLELRGDIAEVSLRDPVSQEKQKLTLWQSLNPQLTCTVKKTFLERDLLVLSIKLNFLMAKYNEHT